MSATPTKNLDMNAHLPWYLKPPTSDTVFYICIKRCSECNNARPSISFECPFCSRARREAGHRSSWTMISATATGFRRAAFDHGWQSSCKRLSSADQQTRRRQMGPATSQNHARQLLPYGSPLLLWQYRRRGSRSQTLRVTALWAWSAVCSKS